MSTIQRQAETLNLFVNRMSMYIGKVDPVSISAFMAGFEAGSDCNLYWTKLISQHIEHDHGIPRRAMGWIQQIEVLSKKLDTSWESAFQMVLMHVLAQPEHS